MRPRDRSRPARNWPFWLLVAAWFFANSPQAAVFELVTWFGQARHFSHQQRLAAEVASILTGQKPDGRIALQNAPARPSPPAIPAEATLKKIELAVPSAGERLRFEVRVVAWNGVESPQPETRSDPPPREPPRFLGRG